MKKLLVLFLLLTACEMQAPVETPTTTTTVPEVTTTTLPPETTTTTLPEETTTTTLAPTTTTVPVPSTTLPPSNGAFEVYPGCKAPSSSFARTIYIDPVNGKDGAVGSQAAPMKTLAQALTAHLIKSGDHVILMAGDHGAIGGNKAKNPELFTSSETIHFDGQPGAKFSSFNMNDVANLVVSNVEVTPPLKLVKANEVVLSGLKLSTSPQTNAEWLAAPDGIYLDSPKCISILDTNISGVHMGLTLYNRATVEAQTDLNVLVKRLKIDGFSGDGIRPLGSNITIQNSVIQNSYLGTAEGDYNHDDGIQMFAIVSPIYHNVIIKDNIVNVTTDPKRTNIGAMQGISCFDGTYVGTQITGNKVYISAWHGISMYCSDKTLIDNNEVMSVSTSKTGWIGIYNCKGGAASGSSTVTNNKANTFKLLPSTVSSNNTTTKAGSFLP